MNCKEIEKYLPLYPDEAGPGIREEIDRHIQQCGACRATLEKLNLYKSYAESAGDPEAPVNFEMKVIRKLEAEQKPERRQNLLWKLGLAVSAAAVLVIIFLIFKPAEKPWEDATEIHFALKMEKKGKGQADPIDFSKINNIITSILSETGSFIEETQKNSITGYYDYMIIGVPGSNLPVFTDKFNNASAIPMEIQGKGDENANRVYFRIYFDMINFTTGNFDGDKHADLMVQFISGKNKGKWVLYKNDDSIHFEKEYPVNVGGGETKYLGDYRLISGDFNGDGSDDICLYEYNSYRGLTAHFLLNDYNFIFKEAPEKFMTLAVPKRGEFVKIISGDADGNGKDDLWWITRTGKGLFEITAINLDKSFKILILPDADSGGGLIIAGDFDNDTYDDICVKYLEIYLRENTDIFLNHHDFTFTGPFSAGLSWQGDYIIWADDYDGDGYDDLFVKSGGPFIPGEWYIMRNNQSGRFVFEIQFQIKYPGAGD